jgi:pyridoxamine 5'-phosphate oxidase
VFGTSYLSRKSRELKENPAAALLFYWAALERQVRICGQIEITSAAESDEIFLHRSPGSRIASRAVRQSEPVESRQVLEELVASEAERYAGKEVDRPDFWGGFNLVPNEIEFWQGGRDRLHDRFLYTKADHEWGLVRLQP